MEYKKFFNPQTVERFALHATATNKADRSDCSVYVYNDEIVLAVNVAIATGRPLLVRGPSGGGKSSLARNVARVLGYGYYEKVISSRTQAKELLWEIDLLRRLQDAQCGQLDQDYGHYINPGVLWWAFDRKSAEAQMERAHARDLSLGNLAKETDEAGVVVLLDEIDKADPDIPNNLLVPLGSLSFQVDETGQVVRALRAPLVFLTTNEERQLPAAFLRRCVELKLKNFDGNELLIIGDAHFPGTDRQILEKVAASIIEQFSSGSSPSAAEYLDTVRACLELQINPKSLIFDNLSKITVWKHGRSERSRP